MDNLTLGANQAISQEDIQKACEIAEIRSDIEQMPMGYQTELSDGAGLSGGQKKQRIALAQVRAPWPAGTKSEAPAGIAVAIVIGVLVRGVLLRRKTVRRLMVALDAEPPLLVATGRTGARLPGVVRTVAGEGIGLQPLRPRVSGTAFQSPISCRH